MTTRTLFFQCATLLFILICWRGNIVSSNNGGLRLKRDSTNEISLEATSPRRQPAPVLRQRQLSHHEDENDNKDKDEDTVVVEVDEITEIPIVAHEDILDETAAPTRAPHHHHSHHDDDNDTKKTPAPTPANQKEDQHSSTPAVPTTTSPLPEERAKPEQQDNDDNPDENMSDDEYNDEPPPTKEEEGDDAYNEDEHGEETKDASPGTEATDDVPSQEQSAPHTKKPISSTDDDEKDEISNLDDDLAVRNDDELVEELDQVETEAKVFGGFGFILAICAMILTAHQMAENPDGIYASVCRLAITIVSCVVKAIFMPCRSLLGNRHHGGHMPISTTEPYRSHAMELT